MFFPEPHAQYSLLFEFETHLVRGAGFAFASFAVVEMCYARVLNRLESQLVRLLHLGQRAIVEAVGKAEDWEVKGAEDVGNAEHWRVKEVEVVGNVEAA